MSRAIGVVALCVAVGGFSCGGGKGPSVAVDAGDPPIVDTDGGGTSIPDAGVREIGFSELCENASRGFRNAYLVSSTRCGQPLTMEDLEHMNYVESELINVGYRVVFKGSDCSSGNLAEQMRRYAEAIDAGRLGYDPSKAFECRALGRSLDGGADRGTDPIGPCTSVFTPKVPLYGACLMDEECVGDAFCQPTSDLSCGGTCIPLLEGGSPCDPHHQGICAGDNHCVFQSGGFYCLPRRSAEANCGRDDDCEQGTICLERQPGDRRCTPLAGENASCYRNDLGDDNCIDGDCVTPDGGLVGLCQPLGGEGDRCGDGTNGFAPCARCLTCTDGGVCAIAGRTGMPCLADGDCQDSRVWHCQTPPGQDGGVCAVRGRRGEPCTTQDGLATRGTCMYVDDFCARPRDGKSTSVGACTPHPKLGEPCGFAFDLSWKCAEGYCSADIVSSLYGTCIPLPGEGGPCTKGDTAARGKGCATEDLFCDVRPDAGGNWIDGTCRRRGGEGDPCDTGLPCADGFFCDPPGQEDGGPPVRICTALLDEGAACDNDRQCQSGLCYPPRQTDGGPPDRACFTPRPVGGDCRSDLQCASRRCNFVTLKCASDCGTLPNETDGCMNYSLGSLSSYLLFALVLVPALRRRKRRSTTSAAR